MKTEIIFIFGLIAIISQYFLSDAETRINYWAEINQQ